MSQRVETEVLVLGGGPAGSTAAAVLASKGRRVLVLEREKFPRYHIGESLIPFTYFTLERLGMIPKLQASAFVRKYSVQFISPSGRASQPFYFFSQIKHPAAQTWQVWRSEFDKMLLDNAREKGATVMEQASAKEFIEEDGFVRGIRGVGADGQPLEVRAKMTIDATGRDAFTLQRKDWKVRDPKLNKIAVWTYFKGAMRDPGIDEGATTVAYVPEKGWFWYIPLAGNVVSVGVVAEREYLYRQGTKDPKAIHDFQLTQNKWIAEHVACGQQFGPHHMTAEYSYRTRYCAADGLLLVGDAFQFLDPVFSSGVLIALRSGEMGADAVDAALTAGDVSAARFDEYGKQLCYGIESMRRLVYGFYDTAFSFAKLFKKYDEMRADVTECLSGHLFRDYTGLFTAVAEFAGVPEALRYGFAPEPAAAAK